MIIDEYDKEYDLCTKKLIEIPLGNTKLIPMDISFGNMLLDDVDVIIKLDEDAKKLYGIDDCYNLNVNHIINNDTCELVIQSVEPTSFITTDNNPHIGSIGTIIPKGTKIATIKLIKKNENN